MRQVIAALLLWFAFAGSVMVADTTQSQTACAQTTASLITCSATTGPGCTACALTGPSSLLTGLIAYWTLDEVSGDRADSTAAGLTLTDVNTVASVSGVRGNAAKFTAGSAESLSRAALVGADANHCISIWYLTLAVATRYTLFDSGGDGDFYLRENGGAVGGGPVHITRGFADSVSIIAGPYSGWNFYVACHDADNNLLKLSRNGGSYTTAATGGANGTPASFLLGNRTGDVEPNDSAIDEVGAFSRILSPAEIACLYNGGSPPAYPFTGVCPT